MTATECIDLPEGRVMLTCRCGLLRLNMSVKYAASIPSQKVGLNECFQSSIVNRYEVQSAVIVILFSHTIEI